jgi:hypothetical protein
MRVLDGTTVSVRNRPQGKFRKDGEMKANVAFYVILSAALILIIIAGLFFLGVITAETIWWIGYVFIGLLIILMVRWRFKDY